MKVEIPLVRGGKVWGYDTFYENVCETCWMRFRVKLEWQCYCSKECRKAARNTLTDLDWTDETYARGYPVYKQYNHVLHSTWSGMMGRCYNDKNPGYKNYGGRGIKVCERWHTFKHFVQDMGLKPKPNYTLERLDNDGDYEPTNCSWATQLEQANNTRRTTPQRRLQFLQRYGALSLSKNQTTPQTTSDKTT